MIYFQLLMLTDLSMQYHLFYLYIRSLQMVLIPTSFSTIYCNDDLLDSRLSVHWGIQNTPVQGMFKTKLPTCNSI